MVKKFILVTRGRTGSTAVLDELGKSRSLCAMQELFARFPWTENEKLLKAHNEGKRITYYELLIPFDVWRRQGLWWERMIPAYYSDSRQANKYLMHAEKLAQSQGVKGFGWKVLSHHFDQRPFLGKLLKQHGYRAIYLKRNSVRQVLSGMVAEQRGIYNSLKNVVDERSYHINLDEFQWHVKWERECVKNDCARLSAEHFDFIEVSYEDYCANREAFYSKVFNFLNLQLELPPPSDFVKMIKEPKMVIGNYDEVANVAAALGEAL